MIVSVYLKTLKRVSVAVSLGAAALALPQAAQALSFDQNVTPDVIFGSGNGNGFWTVDSANNTEVGLRAKVRFAGVYNSNGDGTYSHSTGISTGSAAIWNFEFSINTNLDGASDNARTLDTVSIVLSVDTDPTAGINMISFSPFAAWSDNAVGTNATGNGAGVDGGAPSSGTVVQNSQNLGWLLGGLMIPFDANADATYDFTLSVLSGSAVLSSTAMTVIVGAGGAAIPEAATLGLFGLGLAGLGIAGLRRRGR
jgi:hypothetical protein